MVPQSAGRSISLSQLDLVAMLEQGISLSGALDYTNGPEYAAKTLVYEIEHAASGHTFYAIGGGTGEFQAMRRQNAKGNETQFGRQWDRASDTLNLKIIGFAGGFPSDFPATDVTHQVTVRVFPLIKNGDMVRDGNGAMAQVAIPNWDGEDLGAIDFDPNAIPLTATLADTGLAYLREDNLNRVAEIEFPVADDGAQATQKILQIQYDDGTINHQEIKKVRVYDQSLGSQFVQETEYTYRRIRTYTAPFDFDGTLINAFSGNPITPDQYLPCLADTNRSLNDVGKGIAFLVEQELDVLRAKTQRVANPLYERHRHLHHLLRWRLPIRTYGPGDGGRQRNQPHLVR